MAQGHPQGQDAGTLARFEQRTADGRFVLALAGDWVIAGLGAVDGGLRALKQPRTRAAVIDLSLVGRFDTSGAWLVHRTTKWLRAARQEVALEGARDEHRALLDVVAANDRPCSTLPTQMMLVELLDRIGRGVTSFASAAISIAGFFGLTLSVFYTVLRNPVRLRYTALVSQIEQAGYNAVPIVSLISFLVGAVIAYQGAVQLRAFGADIFMVDLIALSLLREIGILLTAIMVAGRSGSAYAAEIGAMKVHEEVDAMRTLALDPMEILVIPRILALVIAMPLLTFIGDIVGLIGGALVAWTTLDISPGMFIARFKEVNWTLNFWIGMIKAPVFGYLIAMIGCFQGFQVVGSAESVGQRTTMSVVQAIFVVIVVDALFSLFFVEIGW